MTSIENEAAWPDHKPTALLVLADGTVLEGFGLGAEGHAVGEVCFNTAMTGYEEILTDPSYAGQLITFTFPHIGNVGTNEDDIETVNMAATPGARGVILRTAITDPSNYRATRHLDQWLKARGIIGLSGIDTRALTALIRSKGMPNAVIAHSKDSRFDLHGLKEEAREWPGLEGMDLVPMVTSGQRFSSLLMKASNCSGVPPTISAACGPVMAARTAGNSRARLKMPLMRVTSAGSMPAGPAMPCQTLTSNPGIVFATDGVSGICGGPCRSRFSRCAL